MKEHFIDFLKQMIERNSFIQQFVSAELSKAYEEINKRLVESLNRFTPLIEDVSNEVKTANKNLIALSNTVANEGDATRRQLLDDKNALGKDIDTVNEHLSALENGQTQTGNLVTNGFSTIDNHLVQGQAQTNNLLTNVTEGQAQLGNLVANVGNAVVDGDAQLGNQFVNNQLAQQQFNQQIMEQIENCMIWRIEHKINP